MEAKFQSTLPTRGSDEDNSLLRIMSDISIHAPHEGERRSTLQGLPLARKYFNPRSPRGGATQRQCDNAYCRFYFNPRSPRGGATITIERGENRCGISIHAPHEGERRFNSYIRGACLNFNPRSPRGGATYISWRLFLAGVISIHAPHEGERRATAKILPRFLDFNPRSPRGGATGGYDHESVIDVNFNPRSPRGGATMMV